VPNRSAQVTQSKTAQATAAEVTNEIELNQMNKAALLTYCKTHRITVSRGQQNLDGMRRLIKSQHLPKTAPIEEPAAVGPESGHEAHEKLRTFMRNYRSLTTFVLAQVFTVTTVCSITGLMDMSGGNNEVFGGNLAGSVFQLPKAETTTFSGKPLNPGIIFLLTLFVAYSGIGSWTRYFLTSGVATTLLKYRFSQITPMLCSLFGVDLDLHLLGDPLSPSVNNFSNDTRYSEKNAHVPEFTEIIALFANVMEVHFTCLRLVWVMAIEGTLEALRFKHADRAAFDARVAEHTESLLANKEWLKRVLKRNADTLGKEELAGRPVVDKGLADACKFAQWFRERGAICNTSFVLVNGHQGPWQESIDRCCDDLLHTRQNCRVVCLCFRSAFSPSREQWLTLLLEQDSCRWTSTTVPLSA